MEDCLVAAQEGRLRLQASDIDALLLGTDLLQRVATPGVELGAEIDQLVERLSNAPNLPPDASPAPRASSGRQTSCRRCSGRAIHRQRRPSRRRCGGRATRRLPKASACCASRPIP